MATNMVPISWPRSSLSGPATPVVDRAMSQPSSFRAPSAIARATSADTALFSSSTAGETPSTFSLTSLV